MRTHPGKISIITLGCAKNLVDSEVLMKQLLVQGYETVHNPDELNTETVIINTCGFIHDAKQESIDMIMQVINARKQGLVRNIYVMGCLSQRYKDELVKEIPEVTRFFGVSELPQIVRELGGRFRKELVGERHVTTPSHYAYLKVSEGCDRQCSFCAIPLIRGRQVSRPVDEILSEAAYLVTRGVRELILIAQDLTAYGTDRYRKKELGHLLTELERVNGLDWIRLHYAYPAAFPHEVLQIMASPGKICKYLDIPFQHISDKILSRMRRGISRRETYQLIDDIRKTVPGIALRTSLMVGYPGESEEDFRELKAFVAGMRFDRLGVFIYSEEEGTYAAANERNTVSPGVKNARYHEIMEIQRNISLGKNLEKVGQVMKVLVDRQEGQHYIGRTQYDSPEVDNEVVISSLSQNIRTGEFYSVRISGAEEYDLYGIIG